MIRRKTTDEVVARALEYLSNNTNVTLTAPGSTARALVESVASEIAALYGTLDTTIRQAYPSTASGLFLDLLGETVGIRRRPETRAYTLASDRNIRFYVNSGSLGDYIPKGGDPTKAEVPAGTQISTSDSSVIFVTDTAHEVDAAAAQMFITARATTAGVGQNVGPRRLTQHTLGTANVLVENVDTVTTSTEIESDGEFRARIQNAVRAAEGANVAAIDQAVSGVPGVADTVITPFTQGSGSFEILILPIGNRVSLATIDEVTSEVSRAVALGTHFTIREPSYVPISLDITLSMPFIRDENKDVVRRTAASRVAQYIGSLRPNQTLVVNRIREAVLSANSRILDMSIRSLRIKGRPQIIGAQISLASDEVFLPDPEEADPILVR